MIYSPDINTEVVKDFLRTVYKLKKSELKREKTRGNISGQISKIRKKISSKKFDKELIEYEFEKLENAIKAGLERERQILEEQKHGSDLIIQLKNRVDRLEKKIKDEKIKREALDEIKNALQRIHSEVRNRKKMSKTKKKREKELEEKIKKL